MSEPWAACHEWSSRARPKPRSRQRWPSPEKTVPCGWYSQISCSRSVWRAALGLVTSSLSASGSSSWAFSSSFLRGFRARAILPTSLGGRSCPRAWPGRLRLASCPASRPRGRGLASCPVCVRASRTVARCVRDTRPRDSLTAMVSAVSRRPSAISASWSSGIGGPFGSPMSLFPAVHARNNSIPLSFSCSYWLLAHSGRGESLKRDRFYYA